MSSCSSVGMLSVSQIPVDGFGQAIVKLGLDNKAEGLARSAGVERATRLAVGAARVPDDAAFESDLLAYRLREISHGDLEAGAQVHGGARVVAFRCQHE